MKREPFNNTVNFFHVFGETMRHYVSSRRSMKSPRRPERYRPSLLVLEDRLLLSVFTVDNLGDAGTGSDTSGDLRYCISHAANGDDITFADGLTGTIDLTRPLPTLSHNFTITGPGADSLTVERNSAGDFRIFTTALGTTIQISGLTIANGSENQGGAILNNGILTVADDVFSANAAVISGSVHGSGGAIYNGGTLTVMDSVFENNTAASAPFDGGTGGAIDNPTGKTVDISGTTFSGNATLGNRSVGGAIYNAGTLMVGASTLSNNTAAGGSGAIDNTGTLTINGSVFTSNAANGGSGGAIGNSGTLTVNGGNFSGNTTMGDGGAINNASQLMVAISASTFFGNTASGSGGAIDNVGSFRSGAMTVSGSTLSGNTAVSGGAISSSVTLTINNSTVAGNTATGANFNDATGGGIVDSGPLTINNSTVAGNIATATGSRAVGLGGGIYFNGAGPVVLNSCTIADNIASDATSAGGSGGGLYIVSGPNSPVRPRNVLLAGNTANMGPDIFGRISSQGHNLIQDPSQGIGFDSSDLLTVDPLLDPNGLQDNGGPTQTIALLSGSPAIDAGDNTGATDFDQRGDGYPRVVGIVDPNNPVIDIGAFEVQSDGTHPSPSGSKDNSIRSSNLSLGLGQALAFFQKTRAELRGWN